MIRARQLRVGDIVVAHSGRREDPSLYCVVSIDNKLGLGDPNNPYMRLESLDSEYNYRTTYAIRIANSSDLKKWLSRKLKSAILKEWERVV